MRQRFLATAQDQCDRETRSPSGPLEGINDTLAQLLMVMEKLDTVIGAAQTENEAPSMRLLCPGPRCSSAFAAGSGTG